MSTVSAANTTRRGDQKRHGSKLGWPKSHLISQRSVSHADRDMPIDEGRIMVKTTIDVSEQENTTREGSASSMKRYGSQENILPVEDVNNAAPKHTWDPLMNQNQQGQGQQRDMTGNIPMMPLRARTKEAKLN